MAAIDLGPPRPRRRLVSLTPLIDVVFLLLIFFMLAARFSVESEIPLRLGDGRELPDGPPRLVTVGADTLKVNGFATTLETLPEQLQRLPADQSATVVVRSDEDTSVQRVVDVLDALSAGGFPNVALVE
ncbi:MAG: biopolymer transporter ExbD [Pseudomonadota bacterium]